MGFSSYDVTLDSLCIVFYGFVALCFFSLLVFPRAIPPNVRYIVESDEFMPLWHCIRPQTWLIAVSMMSLGIWLRLSALVSSEFIVGFYTGLGLSLWACVVYYIRLFRSFRF